MSDLLLAQQLLAVCGQYVEAKAAAIELNNQADEIERLRAALEEIESWVNDDDQRHPLLIAREALATEENRDEKT